MAIAVMMVIIFLNIALLLLVLRIGTQGEHHGEFKAEQSAAVMTLHSRLGISSSESSDENEDDNNSADESDSE